MAIPFKDQFYDINGWRQIHGALIFNLDQGNLNQSTMVTHKGRFLSKCSLNNQPSILPIEQNIAIERVNEIDERLMSFSNRGLLVHEKGNPKQIIQKVAFPNLCY